MRLLHFWIFEFILISYTIFGQYSNEALSRSSEVSSGEDEPPLSSLIEDIFNLSIPNDIPTTINPTIENQNGSNTGEIVGDCKCLPTDLCGTAFLRIKNKDVCKVTSDMLCCSLFNSSEATTQATTHANIPAPLTLRSCGQSNPNGLGYKIPVKSYQAKNGEFPWVVSILREMYIGGKKYNVYRCGGSLIHPKVILTSAGCVKDIDVESLLIRAGDWDTQNTDTLFPHEDRKVEKVIIHDRFNSIKHANDIALLYLDSKFDLTDNIQTICIKKLNFSSIDLSKCVLNGWGKDTYNGHYSYVMKKIDLRVMERSQCLSALKRNHSYHMRKLPRSLLCANNNSDWNFCEGDEGSPLVCPIGHTFYQVGIASAHFNCGENKLPSLFVNVSIFNNWIHNRIPDE